MKKPIMVVVFLAISSCMAPWYGCSTFCPKCPPSTVEGIKPGQVVVDLRTLQDTISQRDYAIMKLKECRKQQGEKQ
jgi:hypothetical protein